MKKILVAEFKHETNRFSPGVTDENDYLNRSYYFGEEILSCFTGAKNELGAFIDYFAGDPEIQLLPVIAFNAQPGGVVAASVYDFATKKILEALEVHADIDGILLSLHGAMVSERTEDGEGDLLERLRLNVGDEIPIMATLDLHCNLTRKMAENATAFFVYDYYPHTDTYETGLRAAACMAGALMGRLRPVMRCCKLDMLMPYMPTVHPAIAPYVQQEQQLRGKNGIISINICHGFFAADIYEQGAAVIVVADGDAEKAQSVANQWGGALWADRTKFFRNYADLDAAIDEVLGSDEKNFVFADVADNPGAGGTCDSTHILRRLIERGVKGAVFALICDPETVALAERVGVGSVAEVELGSKICPDITGDPIHCKAYVKAITDGKFVTKDYCPGIVTQSGKTAVLVVDDIEIIVSSIRTQPWDLEIFRANGITPEEKKLLVTKSSVHYRASFGKIARKIFDIEEPALAPQSPRTVKYTYTRRPIYPLDPI